MPPLPTGPAAAGGPQYPSPPCVRPLPSPRAPEGRWVLRGAGGLSRLGRRHQEQDLRSGTGQGAQEPGPTKPALPLKPPTASAGWDLVLPRKSQPRAAGLSRFSTNPTLALGKPRPRLLRTKFRFQLYCGQRLGVGARRDRRSLSTRSSGAPSRARGSWGRQGSMHELV